jgi:hypothetical protein
MVLSVDLGFLQLFATQTFILTGQVTTMTVIYQPNTVQKNSTRENRSAFRFERVLSVRLIPMLGVEPVLVVGMIPIRVVGIEPAFVVGIIPDFVVAMFPDLARAVAEIEKTNMIVQEIEVNVFIFLLLVT